MADPTIAPASVFTGPNATPVIDHRGRVHVSPEAKVKADKAERDENEQGAQRSRPT